MTDRCPRCNSPNPKLHPAMQFEGEVQTCSHPWHGAPQSTALSSPPAQGLREALETIRRVASGYGDAYVWWGTPERAETSRMEIVAACETALSPPGPGEGRDGWVQVDEAHPIPPDLQEGDELIVSVKGREAGLLRYNRITAYRRRSKE